MLDRLYSLLVGLGAPDGPETMDTVKSVERAYSGSLRHYHNLGHIFSCLVEFDSIRNRLDDPVALEVAVWFHDVEYNPLARNNEKQSAVVVDTVLQGCNRASKGFRDRVRSLILATDHVETNDLSLDAKHLLDIDLSVLGSPWPSFKRYDEQIRMEYLAIPADVYITKRLSFLRRLLGLGHIYHTAFFWEIYEATARENISRLIGEVEAGNCGGKTGNPTHPKESFL